MTSFGLNAYCRGVDFAYRTDQVAVLEWIRSVIGDEEYAEIEFVTI